MSLQWYFILWVGEEEQNRQTGLQDVRMDAQKQGSLEAVHWAQEDVHCDEA